MRQIRVLGFVTCLLVVAAQPAHAGLVFGTIRWQDGSSSTAGLPIQVQCAKGRYDGTVQERGDYRIYVGELGNCRFNVTVGGQQAGADVGSYEDEVRYDFVLVRTAGGVQLVRQ